LNNDYTQFLKKVKCWHFFQYLL